MIPRHNMPAKTIPRIAGRDRAMPDDPFFPVGEGVAVCVGMDVAVAVGSVVV